jgi:hypothetical protein
MPADQIAQLINGIAPSIQFLPEPVENQLRLITEELSQNIIFAFEIEIDGTVRDARFPGDFRHPRIMEALTGENLDRRSQNTQVFIVVFIFFNMDAP